MRSSPEGSPSPVGAELVVATLVEVPSPAVGTDEPVAATVGPAPPRRRVRHPLALTMAAVVGIALVVWFVAYWSVLHPPEVAPVGPVVPGADAIPTWFRGWAHWDAAWYETISRDGYSYQPGVASSVAFFPVYPLLIRVISLPVPGPASPLVVGSLVTLAAGLAAFALAWVWCRSRGSAAMASTAVLLLAVFPYAIYLYGPVYADALFLAGVLGAFVLLERDRVAAAALLMAVVGAARPAGLIVAGALALRLLEIRRAQRIALDPAWAERRWLARWSPRLLLPNDWVIAVSASGFLAYCFYLASRFHDPLAFSTTQASPGWDQPAGFHTWFKVALVEEVARKPLGPAALGLMAQALLVVAVVALAPVVGRRIGVAYAWMMVLLAAMVTLGSKDFQGAGRYLLPAMVPVAALAGTVLARHRVLRAVVLAGGFVTLGFFASWFAKGNYLA